MHSIINRLLDLPQDKFYIGLFIIAHVVAMATATLLSFITGDHKEDKKEDDTEVEEALNMSLRETLVKFLETCILTAYIETILIQWAIFRMVALVLRGSLDANIVAFFISTIVFAGLHIIGKKWYYIFIHLPSSISLALVFMLNDINQGRPILYTFIFHSIWNTIAVIGIPFIVRISLFFKERISLVKSK